MILGVAVAVIGILPTVFAEYVPGGPRTVKIGWIAWCVVFGPFFARSWLEALAS